MIIAKKLFRDKCLKVSSFKLEHNENLPHKCNLYAHVLIAPIIDNTTITIYSLSDGFYAKKDIITFRTCVIT